MPRTTRRFIVWTSDTPDDDRPSSSMQTPTTGASPAARLRQPHCRSDLGPLLFHVSFPVPIYDRSSSIFDPITETPASLSTIVYRLVNHQRQQNLYKQTRRCCRFTTLAQRLAYYPVTQSARGIALVDPPARHLPGARPQQAHRRPGHWAQGGGANERTLSPAASTARQPGRCAAASSWHWQCLQFTVQQVR